jgi:WD40 repeat protein
MADIAPLQLYSSGLLFAPKMAIIRQNFKRELPHWIDRGPRVEENWSPELQTLEGHSDSVQSVAFSSDGRLLASGSDDNTIKLWDPATSTLKHTLEGHSDSVQSVAFSSDSSLLASGSDDNTIKLWDPATGTLKHTLEGHSNLVQSVAFSSDGCLLASGSYDNTVKLWDPATGILKHTINTDGVVTNVRFSKKLPHLITNLGSFNIQAWHENFSSDPSETKTELSMQANRWVAIGGQKEVWLPPDYGAISFAVKDGTIALGSTNGRVCIIQFSI